MADPINDDLMRRLTKPQRELYESLPTTCADSYAPARKLVELGLAIWEPRKFSDWLVRRPSAGTGSHKREDESA